MARFLLDDGRNEEYAVRRDALRAIADEHCAIGVEWLIMLLRDAPSMNQCISPTSLVLCLDLLSRATKGRTRNELGAVIRETQVHMQVLRENILCSDVLKIGNAIWSNRRILSCARRRFEEIGATVGIFSSAEQLRADSSDWVSGVTDGRIRDVFAYIPDQTFLALANVIAFKDDWRQPFRPSQTVLKPFAKSATEDVEVPMMRNRIGCDYDRGENFSAVKLSYMSSASMRIILPDRGLTVNEVLKSADFTKLLSRKLRLVGEH